MLILVGISIRALTTNGIITNSKTAANEQKIKEHEEKLNLILTEAQIDTEFEQDKTVLEKVKEKIEAEADKYQIKEETGNSLTIIAKPEGYTYEITENGVKYIEKNEEQSTSESTSQSTSQSTSESTSQSTSQSTSENSSSGTVAEQTWTQTADKVHVTNGTTTLEVGSQVTGYSVTVNGATYGNGKWYVLGAKNGKLLITTNSNVTTVTLSGQDGYARGISTLNTEAAKYTNTNYAEGNARTIDVDDINRVTGYDPDVVKWNSGTNVVNQWDNYVTYTKNSSDGKIYYKGTKYPITSTTNTDIFAFTTFTYWTGTEWKTLDSGESSTPIKHTYYWYYPQTLSTTSSTATSINGSSKAYSLLFANTSGSDDKNYWLGSQCVLTADYVWFGLRMVWGGRVFAGFTFYSWADGSGGSWSHGVRPVVTLKSTVKVASNGTLSL